MLKNKKKFLLGILITISIIFAILVGACFYFYNMAFVPGHKDFLSAPTPLKPGTPFYEERKWYADCPKQTWYQETPDGYRLDAYYIPAATATNKTAIADHGYMQNKKVMGAYAALFHNIGYNVLLPDLRDLGDSQGKFIGYGWPDRKDMVRWANEVITKNGQNSQIVMFGISMGGTTMAMTSGEANLPKQVKAFIVDSPYTSVEGEIEYQAMQMFHIPYWPLFPIFEQVIKFKTGGYDIRKMSTLNQVKKDKVPILYIAGTGDTFVPYKDTIELYKATKAPKELLLVPHAKHVKSYQVAPQKYQQTISNFLKKYIN